MIYSSARLAALRIVIALLLLFSPEIPNAVQLLSSEKLPSQPPPWGFTWMVEWVGFNVQLAWSCKWLIYIGAGLGLIGHGARTGFGMASLGLFYLLGTLQMHGATVHCHHLLWLSIALACSPCSDSFRLGAPMKFLQGDRYQHSLHSIWLLLGMIFFFPGLHKLFFGGSAWFSGETIQNTVLWKQAQYWDQPIRLAFSNTHFYTLAAWGSIIFELGAPLLLLLRRQQLFLILAAVFHIGTAMMLNIHFHNLWPCYIVLLPFERWISHLPTTGASTNKILLLPLLIGVCYAGIIGKVNGWPFACYPTFHQAISDRMPLMSIVLVDDQQRTRRIDHHLYLRPNNLAWGENWQLAGFYSPVDEQALQIFWKRYEHLLKEEGDISVQFFRSQLLLNNPEQEIQDLYLLYEQPLSNVGNGDSPGP